MFRHWGVRKVWKNRNERKRKAGCTHLCMRLLSGGVVFAIFTVVLRSSSVGNSRHATTGRRSAGHENEKGSDARARERGEEMDCQHEHRPARAQSTWQHAGVIERPRVRPSAPRLALQGWALWLTQPRTFGTHHAHDPTIQRATQSYTGTRSLYITDHAFIMLDPLAGCAAAAHLGLQGAKPKAQSSAAWLRGSFPERLSLRVGMEGKTKAALP